MRRSGAGEPTVVWLSGAFGYGDDLVYFADVFGEFARRFPRGRVLVADTFPVQRYPELPLVPLLRFRVLGVTARRAGGVVYRGLRRIPTFVSFLQLVRLRPQVVVVVEFTPTALVGVLAAKLARARTVLLIESDPSFRGAPTTRLSRFLKRRVGRLADVVLVSNEIGARYVREVVAPDPARLRVGPYLTSAPTVRATRRRTDRTGADRARRLLFLNSVTDRKGILRLVDALADVPGDLMPWCLDVVGDGSDDGVVRSRVRELGLSDRVKFFGRVRYEDTAEHYRRADLVICPTLADYRSLSGFEAVNAGVPVMVSCYDGSHAELEEHAPGAVVFDPQDHPGFVAVLTSLLTGPRWSELAEAAAVPPEQFTMRRVGENLELAIRRALD